MRQVIMMTLGLFFWALTGSNPALCLEADGIGDDWFDQHGVPMLLIDPQSGAIVDANNAAANFYGYSVAQLRQLRIQQINTLTDQEALRERLRAAREKNNYFVFRHQLANGELRTVEVYSSPVRKGERTFLLAMIHDASHREKIQAELARDEARLRHAEHVASFGHWIFDLEQEIYTLSPGAQALFGLEGEQWSDDILQSLVRAEDRTTLRQRRQRLIEQGQPYDIEIQIQRNSDGKPLHLRSRAEYDPEKRLIFGIVKDVTDQAEALRLLEAQSRKFAVWSGLAILAQFFIILLLAVAVWKYRGAKRSLKEREKALRERSETIRLLLDSTAEAIYGIDLQGRCTFCNAACLRLLGFDQPEQLIGANMHEKIHHARVDGTSTDASDCRIFKALKQQQGTHADNEVFWRADGTCFPIEYWSHPILRDGEIIGAVVTFLDITQRKQAEKELERKNLDLERVTYTVSHDLKSPLVTIASFLSFLEQDLAANKREQAEKDIAFIRSAVDRMQRLIGDLLELSRVGRKSSSKKSIRWRDIVDESLGSVAGSIVKQNVDVQISPKELILYADRQQLVEIWQNLIDNAVKYSKEQARPQVEIGFVTESRETVFFVRDNGRGVESRHQEKVFDLFEKLDANSDGSGIGLALVKRVVELHNGRIWVESGGAGTGSCFRFTLPDALIQETENLNTMLEASNYAG